MHPTLILFLWLFAVVLIQRLPTPWLAMFLLVAVLISNRPTLGHWGRLLKRSRWLLVVLALTVCFLTPGERLASGFPVTQEGVSLAIDHLLRLVAVLYAVAWLVGGRSLESLQEGLWGVAHLFRSASMKRAVARLSITLRYAVEPRSKVKISQTWQVLLADMSDREEGGGGERFEFVETPIPVFQGFLVTVAGIATVLLWWTLA